MTNTLLRNLRAWAAASLAVAALSPAASAALLSGFEGDLSTTLGPSWQSSLSMSFGPTGATQGSSAVTLAHGTGWTQNFTLDGGPALAQAVANADKFHIDTTTPATTSWRQLFIIMQGDNRGWSQYQFDLAAGVTSTVTLDLVSTGVKASALAGGQTWWQIFLVLQGGDSPSNPSILTTLDNIRFTTAVPEPATLALAAAAFGMIAVHRRRR